MMIKRPASVREVILHFLQVESTRPQYAFLTAQISAWQNQPDDRFMDQVRQFAAGRNDVNPVFTWTVGTQNNRHHERVQKWVLAQIPLGQVYSDGINSDVNVTLASCGWNLGRLAQSAAQHPEFRITEVPSADLLRLVAIHEPRTGRGEYQIVDGAHRAVSMLVAKMSEAEAYVAELRN